MLQSNKLYREVSLSKKETFLLKATWEEGKKSLKMPTVLLQDNLIIFSSLKKLH